MYSTLSPQTCIIPAIFIQCELGIAVAMHTSNNFSSNSVIIVLILNKQLIDVLGGLRVKVAVFSLFYSEIMMTANIVIVIIHVNMPSKKFVLCKLNE